MEIEGGGGRKENQQQRYKVMTGGTDESREQKQDPGQINCNDSNHCISPCFFFFSLLWEKKQENQIFETFSHIADICITGGADATLSPGSESFEVLWEQA